MKFVYLLKLSAIVCLLAGLAGCESPQGERSGFEPEGVERENPEARAQAEFDMVKDPATGQIPKGIRQAEMKAAMATPVSPLSQLEPGKTVPTITVTPRGPNNYGGRTRAIGFDVRNTDIMVAGGVSGGIFRSTDAGGSWSRVTPAGAIHNIVSVAQDTRAGQQDTWYAGTGEQVGNSASATGALYAGNGIFKSTDNGATWTVLSSTNNGSLETFDNTFDFVGDLWVSPTSGNVFAHYGEGVVRSTDGGSTWSTVVGSALQTGSLGDILYNANSSTIYVAINGGTPSGGIHASTDDGATWSQIRTATDLDANGVGRIVLSNLGATSDIAAFYQLNQPFSCGNGAQSEGGLQTFDGTNWTDHTDKVGNCNTGSAPTKVLTLQGGYNMAMTSKPNDANLIYFGGTEIYRYNLSTEVYDFIGGSQQGANAINLHVDNHNLSFVPGNNDIMWSGNDGGLRSTDVTGTIKTNAGDDNGYDWSNKNNNYVTYQYFGGDINPATGSAFVGGAAQDNAFSIHPTDAAALEVGPTADGIKIGIISGTSFTNYHAALLWQQGGFMRIENGTQIFIQPDNITQPFNSTMHLDQDNTNILYYPSGDGRLFRTTNLTGLTTRDITGDASTGWEEFTGLQGSAHITAFATTRNAAGASNGAYSASDTDRKLYFGDANGDVYRLADPAFGAAGTAPVSIKPPLASGNVSSISVNPENDKEVLLTYSNYGVPGVWHTMDASVASPSWTNVEGAETSAVGLASVRSSMIVRSGTETVYLVGTSTGLYATDALSAAPARTNGAATNWQRVGTVNDIGLAVGNEMRLRPSDNQAVLATHGNGLFQLSFPKSALPVEYLSFTGAPAGKGNTLNWVTAAEEDNSGFDVEKSADGQNFERVAFVPASQAQTAERSYEYFDTPVTSEVTYYRLKQIDFDGTSEYSEIISVRNGAGLETGISLFPNPVVNNLTVVNGEGEAVIINAAGQQVSQVLITSTRQDLDVSALPAGTYVLRVKQGNGEFVNRKFIK